MRLLASRDATDFLAISAAFSCVKGGANILGLKLGFLGSVCQIVSESLVMSSSIVQTWSVRRAPTAGVQLSV